MPEPLAPADARTRLPGWLSLTGQQAVYQLRLLTGSTRSLPRGGAAAGPRAAHARHGRGRQRGSARPRRGLAALGVVSSAFVTQPNTLVIGRESGVLRRWRMTPLPPGCFFAGKIAATVVVADASALLTVLVAALTGAPVSAAGAAWMLIPAFTADMQIYQRSSAKHACPK
jgi:hypothetical protein